MSSDNIAIRVNNIGKCYEMYGKPSHRLWQTLTMGRKKFYQEFWALRDINFEVKRGDCVGIIGRNGAGKSTLLQIITGTLTPTTGDVKVRGRVAALLELGSGFNPEFTGRDNIYMNASILGLSKAEIAARYDEIAAFADIGDFINQPVKTYSSGMLVRLAFAVQVQIFPDILIIDEALAVGDAAFQFKCMNFLEKLRSGGTTLLFVSHSVATIREICTRAIWLKSGELAGIGDVNEVTGQYQEYLFVPGSRGRASSTPVAAESETNIKTQSQALYPITHFTSEKDLKRWGSGEVRLKNFFMGNHGRLAPGILDFGEMISIIFEAKAIKSKKDAVCGISFSIKNLSGTDIIALPISERGFTFVPEAGHSYKIEFKLKNILAPGSYVLVGAVEIYNNGEKSYADYVENICFFEVSSHMRHCGIVEPDIAIIMDKA